MQRAKSTHRETSHIKGNQEKYFHDFQGNQNHEKQKSHNSHDMEGCKKFQLC